MTEHAQAVTPADDIIHAAALMRDNDIGFLPVVRDRESLQLIGVITDRDIAIRHVAGAHGADCRVGQHMTAEDLATVAAETDLKDIYELMSRRQVRRVPVVDNEGRILGVIAQADVAVKAQQDRETGQVVADISEPAKPLR